MGEDNRRPGHSGQAGEDGRDPWASPQQQPSPQQQHDRLTKKPEGVADQPTVTSAPGSTPGSPPGSAPGPAPGSSPGSPVGPPPPAPEGPQSASAYGSGPAPGPAYGGPGGPGTGYGAAGGPGYGGPGYGGPGGPGGSGYGAGYPPPGYVWGQPRPPQGTAVASMVLGIIGLVLISTCWGAFVGIFVAPLALILGVNGRRKADRGEAGGRNYATSGFVMGIVGTVLAAVIVVLLIVFIANAEEWDSGPSSSNPDYYDALRTSTAVAVIGR